MLETKRKDKTKRWPSLFFSARVRLSHDSPGGQTQRTPGGRGEGDAGVRWREGRGVRRDLRHAEELFGALVGAGTREGRGGRGSGIQANGCANRKRVRFRERGVSPAPLCLPTARATGLTLGRRSGWLSSGHQAVRASLFYFWFSRPPAFHAFSTLPEQISQKNSTPRQPLGKFFSSDAAPKFPPKFPRFTVPRVQRFGLGQWGNSSWTPGGGGGGVMIFPFPRNITQYTLQLVQRTEIRKRGKIGTFESRTSRVTSSTGRSSTREGGAGATRTTPLEPKRGAGYFATP